MITRALASLSDTPRFEKGTRAFDVTYRTSEGDSHMAVLTSDSAEIGQQIRNILFDTHPEATDYTFSEFDYLAFQMQAFLHRFVDFTLLMNSSEERVHI